MSKKEKSTNSKISKSWSLPHEGFGMHHIDIPYVNRDISWLGFNARVLQEAKDPQVPLLERLKFLAIYSNNLDEFFRVRVGQLRNLVKVGKKTKRVLDYNPELVLREVLRLVNRQQEEFSKIFEKDIIPNLKKHKVHLLRRGELNEVQREYIERFFKEYLLPYSQPVLLVQGKIRPFLVNRALDLVVLLRDKDTPRGTEQYAITNIPSDHLPRFIELPAAEHGRHDLILLDDVVRHNIVWLFPGYDILDSFSIKLTRDAELYIDDEFDGDLIGKIKQSLNKRAVGPAARLVYDREMPRALRELLRVNFELEDMDMLPEGRYHNNFDFFRFPTYGLQALQNPNIPALEYPLLEETPNIWEAIKSKDHLLYSPYHKYDSVLKFFEEAANDPKVSHIKIIQYRVARNSKILNTLMEAVENGKQVSVFVEVKARFDEEANLKWAEKLEKAGVNVHYSFPGVKVHSKLALVTRQEDNTSRLYCFLSTGNFHEDTAKVYTDFHLFTADEKITREVARVFNFLETTRVKQQNFKHLLVGQFNLRERLIEFIDTEIQNAKKGLKATILLKMNSLQDEEMIRKLYEASQAGVKVRIIVRGICSLVPGVKGFSDNIKCISIVDRYLEHARVFIFHNGGKERYYLSSADWMVRNLSFRIETAFPVYDPDHQQMIKALWKQQWNDNVKARVFKSNGNFSYRNLDNEDVLHRSQIEAYYLIKRMQEAANASREEEADVKETKPKNKKELPENGQTKK